MFILFSVLYALFFFGSGWAVHKTLNHRKLNAKELDPPSLQTPDDVLCYLEACAETEPDIKKLLEYFNLFVKSQQKQLPAHIESSIEKVDIKKPRWYHNADESIPCEEHWKLFLEDLESEVGEESMFYVVKHWMVDRAVSFTDREFVDILKLFGSTYYRAQVRDLYSRSKKLVAKRKRAKK
jgi:hypothetical protein